MSILTESTEEQLAAITHGDGPMLIVAGAGTGKTRVITARIAWLITELNVKTDEILALTFTEKAALEMEERVDKMVPYGYVDLWISTFHSFCDKILKRHALDIGLPNNYRLINETEAWLLVQKNLSRFKLDYYRPLGNPTKFIHALLKHFSRCKDEGITPQQYLEYAEGLRLNMDSADFLKKLDLNIALSKLDESERAEILKSEVARIGEVADAFHVYQQILLENDCLDFADLISGCLRLLKERPLICEKYRQQFKYILVDEFQDTNFVQYELIKILATTKNNLTVVGDDDQSIYKFRGASISNIMDFKHDYPDSKTVVLSRNYRSSQEILDISHRFIKQNDPNRLEVTLKINKQLTANTTEPGVIEHLHATTAENEVKQVLGRMQAIHDSDTASWSDFAILARANDSLEPFIAELQSRGIPYQYMALRGLYNKETVIDLMSYLKVLDNHYDSAAMYRVLGFSYLELAPEQIVALLHFSKRKTVSLYDAAKQAAVVPGLAVSSIKSLTGLIAKIEHDANLAKRKNPSEVLLDFLYNSGYLKNAQVAETEEERENLNYLQQLFEKVRQYEASTIGASLTGFLDLIKLELEAGESGSLVPDAEAGPELVKLMTVHGSKGLEFQNVFIVNLVDRRFPTDERHEAIEIPMALVEESLPEGDFHLEEERRLFYVGMTRAKKRLFFTSANDYGGAREKKLSRFLIELGYAKQGDTALGKQKNGLNAPIVVKPQNSYFYEIPEKFSFSQMQSYEMCPLKYKLGNVLKIPTFGNAVFSFGTTVHNTLQSFMEELFNVRSRVQPDLFGQTSIEKNISIERVLEIYKNAWIDEWYETSEQKQEYFEKGQKLLRRFYERFMANEPKVKYLEQDFKFKMGEAVFAGRIDRVDEDPDGAVTIIDYKTGMPKGDKLTPEDKAQLLFYQMASEQVLKLKIKSLKYYYLEDPDNPEREFLGNDGDKEKLQNRFASNIERIKAQDFTPTPEPHICRFCDFRNICEHRKL